MDVEIGTLTSKITTTDSDALLDPRVVQKLLPLLMKHIREELRKEKERSDQQLQPGATAQQMPNWS